MRGKGSLLGRHPLVGARNSVAVVLLLAVALLLLALDPVASSASPDRTCPNKYFRTGPSSKLPDCRAYELVTPRYTAGINPFWSSGFNVFPPNAFSASVITNDGNSTAFMTLAALPGLPGNGYLDEYRAVRTEDGWVSTLNAPTAAQAEKMEPGGVTDAGEYGFERPLGSLSPDLWGPFAGLGRADLLRTPTGVEPIARGSLGDFPEAEGLYISPGAKHVLFAECGGGFTSTCPKVEPNAPENVMTIYDRTPGGPTHLVSLLPGDVTPNGRMEFFGATADGTEVAFSESYAIYGQHPLYVRRNNTTTVEAVRPNGVVENKKLECVGDPASGATIEYQWLRNGAPIPGATGPNHLVSAEDESTVLQCQVARSNAEGKTFGVTGTRVVAPYAGKNFPESEGFAYITPTGVPAVETGQLLTCNPSAFKTLTGASAATISY
jgi:hypothetical protein